MASSGSPLSLYSPCPPGLAGTNCTSATCNSTYVAPATRVTKPANQQACSSCTSGFGGLNCNVCQSENACTMAAAAVGATSAASSSDPLLCYKSSRPISTTHIQCDINQPTLKTLYPNRNIVMTLTKVAAPDNTSLTGVSAWGAQPGTTLSQVWLDGTLQFYCQATGCSSTNATSSIDAANSAVGSDVWTCSDLKCTCLETSLCTGAGSGISMAGIVNSLSGQLSMPCDYSAASSQADGGVKCQFKGAQLTTYLGASGLPLDNCQFGSCVTQTQLQAFWANSSAAQGGNDAQHLSGPVIGGIAVLCAVVAALLALLFFLAFQRRQAKRRPRRAQAIDPALGLSWEHVTYRAAQAGRLSRHKNKNGGSANAIHHTSEQSDGHSGEKASDEVASTEIVLGLDIGGGVGGASGPRGQVLAGISGTAPPGHLVAILGPSGAGKTTLVELLAGRDKRGDGSGNILATVDSSSGLNEEQVRELADEKTTGCRLLSFVDQEDQLPAFSTVREALRFAADLSLPENVSDDEKAGIVQGTITTLGLQAVGDTLIGQRGHRGISGGEKRRVSIGIALVARPRILILDEPLSGLDAYNAVRVMGALRNLASKKAGATTVVLTLHQPSSRMFHSLDKAIVLSRGAVLYDGAPDDAMAWCAQQGHPCPPGHNVADHLLTMAFETASVTQLPLQKAGPTDEAAPTVGIPMPGALHATKGQGGIGAMRGSSGKTTMTTTFFTQFLTLTRRYVQTARRDMSGPLTHLIGHIVVGLVVGGAFFQVKLTIGGFQNRIGSLYFLYMLMLFAAMSSMTLLHSVRPLMARERSDGLYSPWAWLVAHGVYDLVLLRLVPGLLLEIAMYWMVGLRRSASAFFEFLLVSSILYVDVTLYMMTLGALFEDLSLAILVGAAYILLNIGFGGFLLNLSTIPGVLRWVQWLAPLKYALEAITQNEIKGLEVVDKLGSLPVSTSASLIAPGLFGLTGGYYRDLLVLALAFTLGYAALLATSVWWRMRDRR
ncbi:unnamed protein product [Parajaminaea phylloscopi]